VVDSGSDANGAGADDGSQREAVYEALSKATRWRDRDLRTAADVTGYVDAVVADLGVEAMAVQVVQRRHPGESISQADADPVNRIIYVEEPDERGATMRVLALHEIAHVLAPPNEGHGPLFARIFTDLVDRYHFDLSSDIRVQHHRFGVDVARAPSPWARPNPLLNASDLAALDDPDNPLTAYLVELNRLLDP
jgi:hypothetical protein